MKNLYEYSVDDCLGTGDQNITDIISSGKMAWYQKLPWKSNLASSLAKYLPQKYFRSYKTSCGGLEGVRYKSNYKRFKKKWSFKTRGKKLLDAVVMSVTIKDEWYKKYKDSVLHRRSLKLIKDDLLE
jgi:hypothetical protein